MFLRTHISLLGLPQRRRGAPKMTRNAQSPSRNNSSRSGARRPSPRVHLRTVSTRRSASYTMGASLRVGVSSAR
jgi:hypothetical protein